MLSRPALHPAEVAGELIHSLEVAMGSFFEATRGLNSPSARMGRRTRSTIEVLHSRIIWSAWCELEGGEAALHAKYRSRRNGGDPDLAIRSDELKSYCSGRRSLSDVRKTVLAARYPRLSRVMQWPMQLFDVGLASKKLVQAYLKPNLEEGLIWPRHVFPSDAAGPDALNRRPIKYMDLERLFERGDDNGFFTILAAYRLFDIERERDQQWHAARYLVKAAPSLCRLKFVSPQADLLIDLIESLFVLLPDTSFRIEIDRTEAWRQIRAIAHEPCRDIRLAAAADGVQLEAPPDPIVPYTYWNCFPDEQPLLLAGCRGRRTGKQCEQLGE